MRGDPLKVSNRMAWSEYFFHGESSTSEVHDMHRNGGTAIA